MSHLLLRAAEGGDIKKLEQRLEAGDDIEYRHKGTGRTALLYAVIGGHMDAVKLLLEKGADITACCSAVGYDSLCWAIMQGRQDMVDLFLDRGAAPDRVREHSFLGRTPLMVATQSGNLAIVKRLLAARADPSLLDRQGKSAAILAAEAGRAEVSAFLQTIPDANPAPPPAPQTIPWPNVGWQETDPLPVGATPAQIVRGYILAMYRWEIAAEREWRASRENGGHFDFATSLAQARSIRDRYCTAKKRVYERGSIGSPPELDERLILLSEEYPDTRKCCVLARYPKDAPPMKVDTEILFTLLKKRGQWRIDSAKDRVVGAEKWRQVIL